MNIKFLHGHTINNILEGAETYSMDVKSERKIENKVGKKLLMNYKRYHIPSRFIF